MNRTEKTIALLKIKALTTRQISEIIHCGMRGTLNIVGNLRKQGLIHVYGYKRQRKGIAIVWRSGLKPDAAKPPPIPNAVRSRKYRDRRTPEEHELYLAKQRAKRWKLKRDPLMDAFFGGSIK